MSLARPMSLAVDIAVEAEGWGALPDLEPLVRRAVAAALVEAGPDLEGERELSVLLCEDAAIRRLNAQWRGQDKPTNVLSFPAAGSSLPGAPLLLGDIAVAWETTRREADQEGKTLEAHLAHLLVHGVLHLLGHDHATDPQAEAMEGLERRILERLGIADPYAGSDPVRLALR